MWYKKQAALFRFPNQKEQDDHNDGFGDPCDKEPEEGASVFPKGYCDYQDP